MAIPVILPKVDMTMEVGTILRWLKEEGAQVKEGEPLVEVLTDKVNMEVESPASGTLAGIRARPDQTVAVASVIAYIIQPGEPVPAGEQQSVPVAADAEVRVDHRGASGKGTDDG